MENNILFKILLIVDNTLRPPPFVGDLYPNIQAVFLPPITTFMDEGVIAASRPMT